jgi:mono/diheme cytochrome c family protein
VGWIATAIVIALGALPAPGDPPPGPSIATAAPASVEFNRDIRPILSDHCYQCHGPDAARRKANLRLDQESSAKAERDGLRAIVPGDLEASELFRRINAPDPSERMPPVKSGKSLSPDQIDRIRRWIAAGARWQPHWSLIPLGRPPVPHVRGAGWVRNPIDAFILARLEREGLAPATEAARGILIRRVSLDLTGLPPTRSEIVAFENDNGPSAYEQVVDRLLGSPRLGERLATRWLNAARYADTSGYQTDGPRFMWRWRDWVIAAYNRNMPFDQFTIEQLAGDLLPGATLDQKIATGFNRNHRGNSEGGIIPEEYSVEYVVDRVDTTATVWMGLTLACARCHDHKFDPIPQEDFYKVFAYFNNVPESGRAIKIGNSPPLVEAPTRAQREQLDSLRNRLAGLERAARAREPEIARAQSAWERSLRERPPFDWSSQEHLVFRYKLDQAMEPRQTGSNALPQFLGGQPRSIAGPVGPALVLDGRGFLDCGDVAGFGFFDKFTLSAWIKPGGECGGTIISRMVDQPQGEGYSVVLDHGKVQVNLVKRWLDDAIRVETAVKVAAGDWTHLAVTYDGSRLAAGIKVYLDGKPVPIVVRLDELNQSFQTKEPLRMGAGGGPESRFTGAVLEPSVYSAALAGEDVEVLATRESITKILRIPPARRSASQARKVRHCFLAQDAPEWARSLRERIGSARASIDELRERIPTTMVMEELPAPRPTHVLIRGQYDQPGHRVEPGVPACLLSGSERPQPGRLGLARWLVSPGNPLTARVAVNRDWQMLFGTGLVKTLEDFGAAGEAPSHTELLDWLATEFVRSGWDVKHLLRLIVTSATYRQSSRNTPEGLRRDPENRLLARGPRLRLPAELIRDQALALAGLLVERTGGPSVKPYQPPGLWNELADAEYVQDHGPGLYRRSLYTFWKRTAPPPAMAAFDAPGRETCIVRESRTNTPLQALDVLNDVTFVEAARAFAERILRETGPAPEARLAAAFQAATARRPRPQELDILKHGLDAELDRFRRDPRSAAALIHFGESTRDPRLDACELAAYTAMTQLILNLDETITKE